MANDDCNGVTKSKDVIGVLTGEVEHTSSSDTHKRVKRRTYLAVLFHWLVAMDLSKLKINWPQSMSIKNKHTYI